VSKYMSLETNDSGAAVEVTLFAPNPFPSLTEMAINWRIEFPDHLEPGSRDRFEGSSNRVKDRERLGQWLVWGRGLPPQKPKPIKVTAWVTNAIPDELTVLVDQIPAG
jgi:hypothetical protein